MLFSNEAQYEKKCFSRQYIINLIIHFRRINKQNCNYELKIFCSLEKIDFWTYALITIKVKYLIKFGSHDGKNCFGAFNFSFSGKNIINNCKYKDWKEIKKRIDEAAKLLVCTQPTFIHVWDFLLLLQ